MLGSIDRRKASEQTQRHNLVKESLISVAGLIGRPVLHAGDQEVGTVADLIVRWDAKQHYPPLAGVLVKVGRRVSWIPASEVKEVTAKSIRLQTTRLDLEDFIAKEGEVRLGREILDHQLVDVDGVRVVRASDLYVTRFQNEIRLVGVDTGFASLLRRLGPGRWRSRPTPSGVIDWASIQSFGGAEGGSGVKLGATRKELRQLKPGELADLLEDLGRDERQELLTSLPVEQAADALEEMQPEELETLLRESDPHDAAGLLAEMEPDEAADALRDVDADLRDDLLSHMPDKSAEQVEEVLSYEEHTAGGSMNTAMIEAQAHETAGDLQKRLRSLDADELDELESIVVVDEAGKLVYDLPLVKLLVAPDAKRLVDLADSSVAVATVPPDAQIEEVAEALIASRRSSVIVVNDSDEPLGRILADDVIDAMLPEHGRFRFPRILS